MASHTGVAATPSSQKRMASKHRVAATPSSQKRMASRTGVAATPSSQKRMASKPHRGDEASRPRGKKKQLHPIGWSCSKSSIEASVVSARRGPAAIREQAQPSSRQRQQRKRARLGHDRDRE